MRFRSVGITLVVLFATMMQSAWALGGLQPSVIRAIFEEGAKETSVSFANRSKQPLLVQAWVDDGDEDPLAAKKQASFFLSPPVFRVDPEGGQVVRLFLSTTTFPKDRESVAYLNVLYVDPSGKPPEIKSGSLSAAVKFSIRQRIKIFYRPKSIGSVVTYNAPPLQAKLVGQAEPNKDGTRDLEVSNPGPFHVSLAGEWSLASAADSVKIGEGGMFAPFEKRVIKVPIQSKDKTAWSNIVFNVATDYGNSLPFTQPLSAP